MRIGIGLPAAVPGADMTSLGRWAEAAEDAGFASVGVIDRLIYDNLDPLTALAAAAARTERVELISTVVNVNWRNNPPLLAKQLESVDRLSGGRLIAGLGMGGWPADYEASGVPREHGGRRFEAALDALRGAAMILLGGAVPNAYARAASPVSDGWVAPLFGLELLRAGRAAVLDAWERAGRAARPRIVTGRYFCLGPGADATADDYIEHYYGRDYFGLARADTLTTAAQIDAELERLAEAGCDDVVLYPCSGEFDQIRRLASVAARREPSHAMP
jgi:alkanesulfonate monooxygenase SsuD/methylene tetrahydromethanopterin reductase-like flavin-dependent oxidoreductase (luciferase family)